LNKERDAEFELIKQSADLLEQRLLSADRKVVEEAEQDLSENAKKLRKWADKHGVVLSRHVSDPAGGVEVRRWCAATKTVTIDGKVKTCVLIGREGLRCLYDCS